MILIGIINKLYFHLIRKINDSWKVTEGIINFLLNERNGSNKRLFLFKEDPIDNNNTKNLIHISLAIDTNFLYPALVLMTSILENNNNEKNLIIIHLLLQYNFDKDKFHIIESLKKKYEVKINFYIIPNFFKTLKVWRQTYTIYFKVIIPIIFSDLDNE